SATRLRWIHARGMQNGLVPNQVQLFSRLSLVAKREQPIIKTWLPVTNQPCQSNGGTHVEQRIMGGFMADTVAEARSSSRKLGLPSSCLGQAMPSGRKA